MSTAVVYSTAGNLSRVLASLWRSWKLLLNFCRLAKYLNYFLKSVEYILMTWLACITVFSKCLLRHWTVMVCLFVRITDMKMTQKLLMFCYGCCICWCLVKVSEVHILTFLCRGAIIAQSSVGTNDASVYWKYWYILLLTINPNCGDAYCPLCFRICETGTWHITNRLIIIIIIIIIIPALVAHHLYKTAELVAR